MHSLRRQPKGQDGARAGVNRTVTRRKTPPRVLSASNTEAKRMVRTIVIYGALLAAGAFGLQWLEFQFVVRTHATETYLVLIAIAFMGLGVWVGARLFQRPAAAPFEPNVRVRETLGVSDREFEVLTLLAQGRSNKEIAQQLDVSPN